MRFFFITVVVLSVNSCYYHTHRSTITLTDSSRTDIRTTTEVPPVKVVESKPVPPQTLTITPPTVVVTPECGPFKTPVLPSKPVRLKLVQGIPLQKPVHEMVTDYVSQLELYISALEKTYVDAINEHNRLCNAKKIP